MSRYRKKPVVIEARQWDGGPEAATPVIDWVLAGDGTARYHSAEPEPEDDVDVWPTSAEPEHIAIDTLEGTMRAEAGDWIIRGVKGEFYPCKPDIFDATYEPA